jgi:hypothetical protein
MLTVFSDLGSSTSHNPIRLYDLLQGQVYFFFFFLHFIVCNVSFIVSVALCALFCFNVVCYSVSCAFLCSNTTTG